MPGFECANVQQTLCESGVIFDIRGRLRLPVVAPGLPFVDKRAHTFFPFRATDPHRKRLGAVASRDAQIGVFTQLDAALGQRNSARAELAQIKGQVERGFIGFQHEPLQIKVSAGKINRLVS